MCAIAWAPLGPPSSYLKAIQGASSSRYNRLGYRSALPFSSTKGEFKDFRPVPLGSQSSEKWARIECIFFAPNDQIGVISLAMNSILTTA